MSEVADRLMNAALPPGAEGPTISDMKAGETGFTVPWAMVADSDRLLWLLPDYPVFDQPGGTVEMRIIRGEDGFKAWFVSGYRYKPRRDLKTDALLSVVELVQS